MPLTKSPRPKKGRIGRDEIQDWYMSCVCAAKLSCTSQYGEVVVISNFQVPGEPHDVIIYDRTLVKLGVKQGDIVLIWEESETLGQIERARRYARGKDAGIIFISSLLHWPRVWWLTHKDKNIQRRITLGIPRPKEAITDIIFMIMFPIIDLCGGRQWFLDRTKERRTRGVL